MVSKTDYNYASIQDNPEFQRLDVDECPVCESYLLDTQVYISKKTLEGRIFTVCHKCGYLVEIDMKGLRK